MRVDLPMYNYAWVKINIKHLVSYIRDYTAMKYEIISVTPYGLFGNKVIICYRWKQL